MNAIAIRENSGALVLDRERIDLIKRTVCPQGIPDSEFALFIEQCRRSGLDPLIKQAFCVERRQNVGSRENPKWVKKYEFQPAEAGMLARAEQMPDFRGITAQAAYENDEIEIDPGSGHVSHRFKPGKDRGKILGAWAKVEREGRTPVVVWLNYSDYADDRNPMWKRIGATMITKCARVAALRVAYPAAFGGLYIREEMPHEEPPERPVRVAQPEPEPEPEPAQLEPARESFEDQIAQARAMIAAIKTQDDWTACGKALAAYPKGHPVRVQVSEEFIAAGERVRGAA